VPLPPGESEEAPRPQRPPEEEEIDVVAVPLAEAGKSREEAELDLDPARRKKIEEVKEGAPAAARPEPWIQFNVRDLLIVCTTLAVGLAFGRLDPSGILAFVVGLVAVGIAATVLIADLRIQFWYTLLFASLAAYIGAILSTGLRVVQNS
jgi:hypothetical protein